MSYPSPAGSKQHPAIERANEETALPRHFNVIATLIVAIVAIVSYFFPWGVAQ